MKKTWLDENVKPVLALIIIICTYTYFFIDLFKSDKVDPQVIIAIVALSSGVTGYYYGSTSGQTRKDEALTTMAANNSPTVGKAETVNIKENPDQ